MSSTTQLQLFKLTSSTKKPMVVLKYRYVDGPMPTSASDSSFSSSQPSSIGTISTTVEPVPVTSEGGPGHVSEKQKAENLAWGLRFTAAQPNGKCLGVEDPQFKKLVKDFRNSKRAAKKLNV